MTERLDGFTLGEVTARGFEARCVAEDQVVYLWHLGYGLRADPRDSTTTLITDPAALPEGPWRATELGAEELRDQTLLDSIAPRGSRSVE
jgi:hypothetical protein